MGKIPRSQVSTACDRATFGSLEKFREMDGHRKSCPTQATVYVFYGSFD